MPLELPSSLGPTRPNYPLAVTPVTTTATAVQNSIENPGSQEYPMVFAHFTYLHVHKHDSDNNNVTSNHISDVATGWLPTT